MAAVEVLWVQGGEFVGGGALAVPVLFPPPPPPPPPPLLPPLGLGLQGGRGLWSWFCCVVL